MSKVKDRDIVIPGQFLGEKESCDSLFSSCIKENGNIYSLVRGLTRVDSGNLSVIPLNGSYIPKVGDVIVGVVEDDLGGVYIVDIMAPYKCVLKPRAQENFNGGRQGRSGRDRGRGDRRSTDREVDKYARGDIISSKIVSVDEVKEAQLAGTQKLEPGFVLQVKPKRVPRIIGKKRSMIDLIRQFTGSRIVVGQNGLIWAKGGNMPLAIEVLRMVESEAHTSGLTDRVTNLLKSRSKM